MNSLPKTKKSLGQHWLTDLSTLNAIAEAADIQASDTVLEVGPGPGTLTRVLAAQAEKVVAVELDEALLDQLASMQIAKNLQFVRSNILEFDLTTMPAGYKVVANIPYYLTSNLIRVLSESVNPPSTAVILVQKEVAQRVAAEPGNMSILSVTAQYYWEVSLGIEVPARLFTPPPKVDSQVLIMKRRNQPLFPGTDTKQFFRLVKAGFSARRKTVHNSLSGGLRIGKEETKKLLELAQIDPTARPQTLTLDDWHKLDRVLELKQQ
jgi:16S rRNA (adenine1518-N6/adenine1519-N6)-dimethyltransferase